MPLSFMLVGSGFRRNCFEHTGKVNEKARFVLQRSQCGCGRGEGDIVSVAMNVPSKTASKKDIVKVENRELKPGEVDKIALIAPGATINIIRDYEVAEKTRVKLPDSIRGIVKCANPACVSNAGEPVEPKFMVERQDPLRLRCFYFSRIMEKPDVLKQF